MNEYDFEPQQINENSNINQIPLSMPHSLANSRFFNINYSTSIHQALHSSHNQSNIQLITSMHAVSICKEQKNEKNMIKNKNNEFHEDFGQDQKQTSNKNGNGFKHFLEKQKMYEQKVKEKIRIMKENIESKIVVDTFQPSISKKSKQYCKNNNINVFERLSKRQPQTQQKKHSDNLFQPKISEKSKKMIRKQPIAEHLYKDAEQRKQRHYESVSKQQKQPVICKANYSSTKNEELAGKKLYKQYARVLERHGLSLDSNETIDKEIFVEILFQMGFLGTQPTALQNQLLDLVYFQLNGQPNCRNLFGLLLVVIGVYQGQFFKPQNKETSNSQIFTKNQNQSRMLHKKFNILYRNRLSSQEKQYRSLQSIQDPCTFKPHLSRQTQMLAQKHRKQKLSQAASKLMSQTGSNENSPKCKLITHPQFLLLNQKLRQIELSQKRRIQYEKRMSQCTFYPKVSKFEVKKIRKSIAVEEDQLPLKVITEKSSIEPGSPMMILDVDFGGKQQQIFIRKEDGDNLSNIARYYADKYMMDQQSESQLLEMLKSQFQSFQFAQ